LFNNNDNDLYEPLYAAPDIIIFVNNDDNDDNDDNT